MANLSCYLVAMLLWVSPLRAQTEALPADARELLAFHLRAMDQPLPQRVSEARTLERARVYRWAFAEGELRQEIRNLTEDHAGALLLAMVADCWNPANFQQGHVRADAWLGRYPEGSSDDIRLAQEVHNFLSRAQDRRNEILWNRRSRRRWLPAASVIGVVMLSFGVFRLLR